MIELVAGHPKYAKHVGPLLHASFPEMIDFILPDHRMSAKVLAALYARDRGYFSYRYSTLAMSDGRVVGLEISFDLAQFSKEKWAGRLAWLLACPPSIWWPWPPTIARSIGAYEPAPTPNTYYLNNIAISPSQQGKGVGRLLIDHVSQRAAENGYDAIELDVATSNKRAAAVYEKLGFSVTRSLPSSEWLQGRGIPSLVRMRREFPDRFFALPETFSEIDRTSGHSLPL